ncbi:hypothetical protein EXU57_24230 [Segetibacter sp. 3557_3]|nr:hypothetical protein EXU57_24230 [Segetibacter sp. 3557_3]
MYLFERQNRKAYGARSAQEVLKLAKKHSGITKKGSIHRLRHTYATHLLGNVTYIRYIQVLLGHCNDCNIKTTLRYTHVVVKTLALVQSPVDRLAW